MKRKGELTLKEEILRILHEADGYVSGQAISERLGVSRMAVSKAVSALRAAGYEIEAAPRRGYRLTAAPDVLGAAEVRAALGAHPWAEQLVVLPEVDSTNSYAKQLAQSGAPHGTIVIADRQTGGRGRMGRTFLSPAGQGVYFTVLLRPYEPAAGLGGLTALAAVAVCDAIEAACGVRPGIKWTNDLLLGGKKICGILTELSVEAESGMTDFVVIGVGVNVAQQPADFPPELRLTAASIYSETGTAPRRARLAAEMVRAFARMADCDRPAWMDRYRADCLTIGREIRVIRAGTARTAVADGVDENGALLVTWDDGTAGVVTAGDVSVRGLCGYV